MSEWQPIETAPRDGTPILLLAVGCAVPMVGRSTEEYNERWIALVWGVEANWSDFNEPDPIFNATHWMPLPAPPPQHGMA